MLGLGLRLTLRSGREGLVRLLVTAGAVAVGVAILLGVFAEFHAFQAASNRPCWECTGVPSASQPLPSGLSVSQPLSSAPSNALLWNFSENLYQGQFIEQLDVAALGPNAPVPPGIPSLPKAGEYYASPALAALLKSVPADELGGRFPGTLAGTIGQAALSNPGELAIIIGYAPDQLAALPNTIQVDQIATAPQTQGTTNLYRIAFGLGAIVVLFPILILIATATRLAAARREERFAAMRLVGATPGQVAVIASVEAVAGALLGTVLGILVFLALRPVLTDISLSGARFFADTVTPTVWGYVGMLVVVPIAATAASVISLRRVQVSPLGVSRHVTPGPPKPWPVALLVIGLALFAVFMSTVSVPSPSSSLAGSNSGGNPNPLPLFVGLILVMVGLVAGGPWLTMQAARLLAKLAHGPSSLLAARRLADDPRTAFRAITGLVLAVFVGTAIAVVAPTVDAAQSGNVGTIDGSLTNVLRVPFGEHVSAQQSADLISRLQAFSGVSLLPIYWTSQPPPYPQPGQRHEAVDCASLKQFSALGVCPPGAKAVAFSSIDLFTDNPLVIYEALPIVSAGSQAVSNDFTGKSLSALLIKTDNAATLERVRTFLTTYSATTDLGFPPVSKGIPLSAWQMGVLEPQTFGEVAQIRNNDDANIERVVLALVGLTLLVAGCSLAVTVGGSLVERKRPFTLLRLSGAPMSALYKVVLQESVLPLAAAAIVAAAVGVGVAIPVVDALAPAGTHTSFPSPVYYITMGAGLALSLLVISATLPLLGRITQSDSARFE